MRDRSIQSLIEGAYLNEWILDKETRGKVESSYEKKDRYRFGLTFSHAMNRLTTASLSDHTLSNTRKALAKTVEDASTMDDIAFLRRDMAAGKILMKRRIEKHPEESEKREARKHLAWLEGEYSKMLTTRASEIKKG